MLRYFEAAKVGSWLGWIFNFGFGSVLFCVSSFEITAIVFFAFSLAPYPLSCVMRICSRTRRQEVSLAYGKLRERWSYWSNIAIGLCTTCKNSQLLKGLGRKFEKAYTSFLHLIILYHLNAKWMLCLKPESRIRELRENIRRMFYCLIAL